MHLTFSVFLYFDNYYSLILEDNIVFYLSFVIIYEIYIRYRPNFAMKIAYMYSATLIYNQYCKGYITIFQHYWQRKTSGASPCIIWLYCTFPVPLVFPGPKHYFRGRSLSLSFGEVLDSFPPLQTIIKEFPGDRTHIRGYWISFSRI